MTERAEKWPITYRPFLSQWLADDDTIRGGLDIATDKTKKNKPKVEHDPRTPTPSNIGIFL